MPFNRMACDIQINVQLVGFKHTEKEEMTVENSKAQTNGDTSQALAILHGTIFTSVVMFAVHCAQAF